MNGDGKPGRQANFVETAEEPEGDVYAFIVSCGIQSDLTLNIGGVPNIKFFIDSGASCNVIDRELWENLKENKANSVSRKCQKRLFAYGSTEPLKIGTTAKTHTLEPEREVVEET